MLHVVWSFIVKKEAVKEFECVYGPNGIWARLFAGHPGFRGTTLLRDEDAPRRYLTIDLWDTEGDRHRMLTHEKARYDELDAALADLTESEDEIGYFISVAGLPGGELPKASRRGGVKGHEHTDRASRRSSRRTSA